MEDIILKKVDDIAEQMIKSIIEIVKIDSVETAPLENAPFGSGVKAALDATLDLAASLGIISDMQVMVKVKIIFVLLVI